MRTLIFILACLVVVIPCKAEKIIVDPNGSADFDNIQDAINYSWDGDTVIVRPGTYKENVFFNGRAITLTSIDPNDPNVVDSTVITTASGKPVTFDFGEDEASFISGFTITSGDYGIYCYASSPTITKNIVSNITGASGTYSAPIITHNKVVNGRGIMRCGGTISCNFIAYNSRNNGGGLWLCSGTITNNIIIFNHAKENASNTGHGGGLYECSGTIKQNIIAGNIADSKGGGLYSCEGSIINNVIIGNRSGGYGGGIYNDTSTPTVKNNIIAYNEGVYGGGIYGECENSYNNLWENAPRSFWGGAVAGTGDISRDPLFAMNGYWNDPCGTPADPTDDIWADGDYHLMSAAGRWDPNTESWVLDDTNSPCIDAGDPCDPIGSEPNPNGGRINMGAYGGTAEASKSPSGIVEPVCTEYPAMDFNKDCRVDFQDFAVFTQAWLDCNLDPPEACWQ